MSEQPKVKKFVLIEADQTAGIPPNTGFDGSSVVDADLEATVLAAVQQDPEWANATAITTKVIEK